MEPSAEAPASRGAQPHPALNAMVICDLAIQEQVTGKTSVIGVFENISAHTFPARCGFVYVYAKITDAQGEYRLRLDLVRLDDLGVIGRGSLQATFSNRMVPSELVFQLGGLSFERPGRYEFRLYANERWVGSKVLNVVEAPEGGPQSEQIRVFGSTVTVRWLSFMLPAPQAPADRL
jgi:hypothetical protein